MLNSGREKKLFIVLSIVSLLISLIYSYLLKWHGDDIFIGFRYIQNLLNGNGLVYNIGERVEGYTDFLWLMLLYVFGLLKFNLTMVSEVLGILFSFATIFLFSIIGYKVSSVKNKFIFPFIAFALAINYDYNVWATSGLETSFFTFLLSTAFYIYFFSNNKINARLVLTGLFLCLAALTRPDALLIACSATFLLLVSSILNNENLNTIIKKIVLLNLSFLIIYLPYFIWRYNYYGFLFPNTYYDKMAYESAYSKGLIYIYTYFKIHFTSFLLLIIPFLFLFTMKKKGNFKQLIFEKENAAFIASLILVYIYLIFFVAKVGGDFMFARFIIPCVPFIYFIIFCFIISLKSLKGINALLFSLVFLFGTETYFRLKLFNQLSDSDNNSKVYITPDIADERFYYTHVADENLEKRIGKELTECFENLGVRSLVLGTQNRFAYYSHFYYCQEYFGLTDTLIAHSKSIPGGRIGHQKNASIEYIENKKIHFAYNTKSFENGNFNTAKLYLPSDTLYLLIFTYDNSIINKLTAKLGKNFEYTNFPDYLDEYLNKTLPDIKSYDELNKDYHAFYQYYFKNNNDKVRENKFNIALANKKD